MNYIHLALKERRSGKVFEMTCVYGNSTFSQRRNLWGKILKLKPSNQLPWCCFGDFNEMKVSFEKDGSRPIEPIRMRLFREFLDDSELGDLELKGCRYTWLSNPRDGL